MKKLKIAIVGCGRISVSYADSFRRLADEIELVYAVDKVPEKAKKFADEFGCAWTTYFDERNPSPFPCRTQTGCWRFRRRPA